MTVNNSTNRTDAASAVAFNTSKSGSSSAQNKDLTPAVLLNLLTKEAAALTRLLNAPTHTAKPGLGNSSSSGPTFPPVPPTRNHWQPPVANPPFDQMNFLQQIEYITAVIASAQAEVTWLNCDHQDHENSVWDWIDGDAYDNDHIRQADDASLDAMANFIGSYEAILSGLEYVPPTDAFANFHFKIPELHVDLSHFSPSQLQTIEAALAALISQLEEIVGLASNDKNKMEVQTANAHLLAIKQSMSQTSENVKNLEAELAIQARQAAASAVFNDIIAAVVCVIAIVAGQPELFIVSAALLVLTATGEMEKMTNSIAEGLEKLGMSENVARIVATLIIVVIAVVATAGMSATGVCAKLGDAVKGLATTVGESLAETFPQVAAGLSTLAAGVSSAVAKIAAVVDQLTALAAKGVSFVSNGMTAAVSSALDALAAAVSRVFASGAELCPEVVNVLNAIAAKLLRLGTMLGNGCEVIAEKAKVLADSISSKFDGLSATTKIAMVTGIQTLESTDFTKAVLATTSKDKEALEILLGVLESLLAVIVAGPAMASLADSAGSEAAKVSFERMAQSALTKASAALALGASTLSVLQANTTVQLADTQEQITIERALQTTLESLLKSLTAMEKGDAKSTGSTMIGMLNDLNSLLKANAQAGASVAAALCKESA